MERERGIRKRHGCARKVEDKLQETRCAIITHPDFKKVKTSFKDMDHHCCCPELGLGWAALRRHPCSCAVCDETIRKAWDGGVKEPINHPQFVNAEGGCFWKPVFSDWNKCHVVEVKPVDKDQALVEEDVAETKHKVLQNVASAIAESVMIDKVGAVATSDGDHK